LPANIYTQIAIDKQVETQLGLPFNQCYQNTREFPLNKTIIDYILSLERVYSQSECIELCFDLIYIQLNPCNCSNTTLGSVWDDCWTKFENSTYLSCTWNFKANFYSKSIQEKCSFYCPLECDSISYSVEKNYIYDQNRTRFKVFFGSLKYNHISQEQAFPIEEFIGTIGDILGIFVGVSFVSLFEIIELLIELIIIFVNKQKNKSVREHSNKKIKTKN